MAACLQNVYLCSPLSSWARKGGLQSIPAGYSLPCATNSAVASVGRAGSVHRQQELLSSPRGRAIQDQRTPGLHFLNSSSPTRTFATSSVHCERKTDTENKARNFVSRSLDKSSSSSTTAALRSSRRSSWAAARGATQTGPECSVSSSKLLVDVASLGGGLELGTGTSPIPPFQSPRLVNSPMPPLERRTSLKNQDEEEIPTAGDARTRPSFDGQATPTQLPPGRRAALLVLASSVSAATWHTPGLPGVASASATPALAATGGLPWPAQSPGLEARLAGDDLRYPGTAWLGPRQLYYPDWLFGTWHVKATFARFQAPLGRQYVPADLVREAESEGRGVGTAVEYEARFYSTLIDTWQNQARVALGALPESRVIADRAHNATSAYDAYLGYDAVESSEYSTRENASRQRVVFRPVGPTGEYIGPRRHELFILNRQSQEEPDGDFLCSELFRRVSIGVRREQVSDSEALYRFHRVSPTEIRARKRRAVYLQPQDALYFETWGRAVALFDYDVVLTKPAGAEDCVLTPKGVNQCIGS